jgi:putative FmdB family regulatory protein
MPTYEYECTKCNHHFERFQGMTEEPLKRCPECRCKLRRLIGTGAGIIFKGSGFYETDYRSAGYQASAKKETDSKVSSSDSGKKKKKAATKSSTDD